MNPDKTVLITGASTGLGLAIARALTKTDYRVYLTARQNSLPRFDKHGVRESEHVRIRALDVTSFEQRAAIVEEAERDWGGIDILINNAGITYRAVVEHVSEEERIAQMDVNFRSPMELIRLVLPGMRQKRAGRIITVSSVGGMMAMPTMGSYSASKFALEGATEALWYEARPWNIKVSLVQPGYINSNSFRRVYSSQKALLATKQADPYSAYYSHMGNFIESLMRRSFSTSESLARIILRTMEQEHPKLRVAGTLDARFFALLRRLLPRRVYHWVLYKNLPGIGEWGKASTTTKDNTL